MDAWVRRVLDVPAEHPDALRLREARAARDGKLREVDAALGTLKQAADAIGVPLLRTAIDTDVTGLGTRRDALATADDTAGIDAQLQLAPKLIEDIGQTTVTAGKDRADCLALLEQKEKVRQALESAEAAARDIGPPLGRTAIDIGIDAVRRTAEGLDRAATREDIAREVAAAPGLVTEIGTVATQAGEDKDLGLKLIAQQEKVRLALEGLEAAAGDIGPPLGRGAIDTDIGAVTLKADPLKTAATRDAIEKEVAAAPSLLLEIGTVATRAAKDKDLGLRLAEQQEKVRLALEAAENAAKAIGAPLGRTAIDLELGAVRQKALPLQSAATRDAIEKEVAAAPSLLLEIGTVTAQATRDGTDAAAFLLKVDEAAAELKKLDTAAKAITGPLAAASVEGDIKKVTDAHADMAKATTRAAIDKGMKAAPQLLLDIDAARVAAEQAEVTWQGLLVKKAAVEKILGRSTSRLTWLQAGKTKTDLEKERVTIENVVKKLDTAATLDAYAKAVEAAVIDAAALDGKLFDQSAPAMASTRLDKLKEWAAIFDRTVKPNAVSDAFASLQLLCQNAKGKPDPGKTFDAIDDRIIAAIDKATKAYRADQSAGLFRAAAQKSVAGVTDPVLKGQIEAELLKFDATRLTAFGEASIDDMEAGLRDLRDNTEFMGAATINKADYSTAIKKLLLQADTAITKLTPGTPPEPELTQDYQTYQQDLLDAENETGFADQISLFDVLKANCLYLIKEAQEAVFTEQAQTDKGKKEIDTLITSFGEGTDDPAEQAVCIAAISARFGVDLDIPKGLSVTTLPTIYGMLAMTGEANVAGLDSIAFDTDPLTTASYYGSKKIVLNDMRDPNQTEGMRDQSDPDKEVRVKTVKTTALHELGHHVDDMKGVMSGGMGKAGFGKWQNEAFDDVVDAVYTPYFAPIVGQGTGTTPTEADLRELVVSLLKTGKATKPASDSDKLGSLFGEWAEIEGKTGWSVCLAIRDPDQNPWDTPVEIEGGRAYHEGYPNDWYSYDISERASGISDYQWRSPVEWFAEQFAFYRLNPKRAKPKAIATYLTM